MKNTNQTRARAPPRSARDVTDEGDEDDPAAGLLFTGRRGSEVFTIQN